MDLDRFRSSPSGRVARVGQGEAGYWAFVPNPLPPALDYTPEIIHTLSRADRAAGELSGVGRSLSNPQLLLAPLMRREAVLSSRIEGTETDLSQLYAYEAGAMKADAGDVREVYNYVQALKYGLERLATLPVSLRLLREMHRILLDDVRGAYAAPGEFRRTQNWIGPPGCTLNDATFVPPPPAELMDALGALESYLHAEDGHPPLVRLAFIHYQFEAIHPFLDGNGRIGRLLLALLLVRWRLLPLPLLYLSAYFERHRSAYYDHLLAVSRDGDWPAWVRFFLEGVAAQATDTVARIKALQDLQAAWRDDLMQTRAPATALRLMEYLFETPTLTITQVEKALNVTYVSASKAVSRLVNMEILQPITPQAKRGKTYQAGDILEILRR